MNSNGYTALSSRVRFARNLETYPFPHKLTGDSAENFYREILPLLPQGMEVLFIAELSPMEKAVLAERQVISAKLAESPYGAVATKGDLSVMMLEEDALRICALKNGFCLDEVYRIAAQAERVLAEKLPFAKMQEFGFLTASFLNVGGGMRASVTVLLPALTRAGKVSKVLALLNEEGLTARGVLGEGSESENALYQISNTHSFARTDAQVLEGVKRAVYDLSVLEREERQAAFSQNPKGERERFFSAVRQLTNAPDLSYAQAMEGVIAVMEGQSLGVCSFPADLWEVAQSIRPATLALKQGKRMDSKEENALRARTLHKIFR